MDAKSIARGVVEGISSVPSGMYDGVIRTWHLMKILIWFIFWSSLRLNLI